MRYYPSSLQNVIQGIKSNNIKVVALSGPNKGLIDLCFLQIKKFIDISVQRINYENTTKLYQVLNTPNLFQKRQIVKCICNNITVNDLNFILQNEFFHILIFIFDDLDLPIKKYFETANDLALILCYNDNNVKNLVKNYIITQKKDITEQALTYLGNYLNGDQFFIKNEIEKLICYSINDPIIDMKQVLDVINLETLFVSDKLYLSLANNNLEVYINELLLIQQKECIFIIRNLIKYFIDIYLTISQIKKGIDFAAAIKKLNPPLFFQKIFIFKQIVENTKLNRILFILKLLFKSEKYCKIYINLQSEIISTIYILN